MAKRTDISRKGSPHWRFHPGEVLRQEFLKPMNLSVYALAKRLRVPAPRINDTVLERRGIPADTAIRLSKVFGTTDQSWLNLQGAYEVSQVKSERSAELEKIQPLVPPWRLPDFLGRGQRAITTVEIPPRGRKSPFTSAHSGFAQRTTSSNTWFTMFS